MERQPCVRSGSGVARAATVASALLGAWLAVADSHAAYNRVQVPIRWCMVLGSPAVSNPACACAPTSAYVPVFRGGRASANYVNCGMVFRGAGGFYPGAVYPNTRTIPDPCDPLINPSCPGSTGDIYIDVATNNLTEYFQVVNACRQAWNNSGISAPGLIGVNIGRFVDAAGNQSPVVGLGGTPFFNSAPSQAAWGEFAVMDDDFFLDYTNFPGWGNLTQVADAMTCVGNTVHPATPPCQAQLFNDGLDVLTGHEIGHALSLGHLSNTLMDAFIPSGVMTPWLTQGGNGQNATVCPAQPLGPVSSQCGQLKLQSICHQNGTLVDPPPVVDELPLTIGDAAPGWIDLELVGLIDDSNTATAGFFWRNVEPFPADAAGLTYEFAVDLDQDSFTGGDPVMVGNSVPLPGAELAGSVTVDVVGGSITTTENLWRWDTVTWLPGPALGSEAANGEVWADDADSGTATALPAHSIVSIRFDSALLSGPFPNHTVRASASDFAAAVSDLGPIAELYMVEPSLSICTLDPPAALPGELVQIEGADLVPNGFFEVHFDVRGAVFPVGSGVVAPDGVAAGSFVVPAQARPGPQTVRIFVPEPGQEVSSVCTIEVLAPDGPPGESSTGASQLLVTGHDPGTGELQVDFQPACSATEHTIYTTPLPLLPSWRWESSDCDHGTTGSTAFTPPAGNQAFVIVGNNGASEGSYGTSSSGERPAADQELVGTCKLPQDLGAFCLP